MELGYHDEVHQHHTQQQHQHQLAHGIHDLFVLAVELHGDALRQRQRRHGLLHRRCHLGNVVAIGQRGGHGDTPPLLVALDAVEGHGLADLRHLAQLEGAIVVLLRLLAGELAQAGGIAAAAHGGGHGAVRCDGQIQQLLASQLAVRRRVHHQLHALAVQRHIRHRGGILQRRRHLHVDLGHGDTAGHGRVAVHHHL